MTDNKSEYPEDFNRENYTDPSSFLPPQSWQRYGDVLAAYKGLYVKIIGQKSEDGSFWHPGFLEEAHRGLLIVQQRTRTNDEQKKLNGIIESLRIGTDYIKEELTDLGTSLKEIVHDLESRDREKSAKRKSYFDIEYIQEPDLSKALKKLRKDRPVVFYNHERVTEALETYELETAGRIEIYARRYKLHTPHLIPIKRKLEQQYDEAALINKELKTSILKNIFGLSLADLI